MPRLYDPLLVMVYADEAVQALLKGDLVNVIVNQNNTTMNASTIKVCVSTVHATPQQEHKVVDQYMTTTKNRTTVFCSLSD